LQQRQQAHQQLTPPIAKASISQTVNENTRILSITPIKIQPAPRIEFNDRRKRCIHCSKIATTDVIFKQEGATIIERYCDSCLVSLKLKK
jgi:hypothetical protein